MGRQDKGKAEFEKEVHKRVCGGTSLFGSTPSFLCHFLSFFSPTVSFCPPCPPLSTALRFELILDNYALCEYRLHCLIKRLKQDPVNKFTRILLYSQKARI